MGGETKRLKRAWRIRQEKLDLIEHEDSSAARVEDAKFGLTQGFIIDPTAIAEAGQPAEANAEPKDAEIRGNLKIG